MGSHGPGHHRLGRAVQSAKTRRLPSRGEPGDPLARRWHAGGINAAELGRHEERAARGWSDLGGGGGKGGEHEGGFHKEGGLWKNGEARLSNFPGGWGQ